VSRLEAVDLPAASQGMLRNARRLLRRKERQSARLFLAEGRQATSEALRRQGTVLELIVADDSVDRHRDLLTAAAANAASASATMASTLAAFSGVT
jgi:TrmH family RNA methyltransferase